MDCLVLSFPLYDLNGTNYEYGSVVLPSLTNTGLWTYGIKLNPAYTLPTSLPYD